MATMPRMVNKQFNSPIGLYSKQNIEETLNKQSQVLNNGAVGIDFNNPINSKPSNLANSAVLRMLEEEEQRQRSGQPGKYSRGRRENDPHVKRIDRMIDWPPKISNTGNGQINMNNTFTSNFFTPKIAALKRVAWPPPPEENGDAPQEAPVRQAPPVKLQQSPALSRLIPIEQEFAPPQSKVYSPQPQQPAQPSFQQTKPFSPQPVQAPIPQSKPFSPQPVQAPVPQSKPFSPQGQQGFKPYSPLAPLNVQKPLSPQPGFGSRSPLSPQVSTPTQTFPPPLPEDINQGYKPVTRFIPITPQSPESFQPVQPKYEPPKAFAPSQGFGPVAPPAASNSPRGWAPVSSPTPLVAPANYQFVEPPPSTIPLRPAAPIHQAPPPVIPSQPATNSFSATMPKGGINMRGDQKWPPQSVKEAVAAENEARISLAKGPACRPRKVKKDYTSFFAQNALPHNYPGYRAPPGTQHFEDYTGNSQF